MDMVKVHFFHPAARRRTALELPRDTRFSALTPLLYDAGFLVPQKPGYRYICQEHMCGMNHTLEDYLPADAAELYLDIFQFPQVLV